MNTPSITKGLEDAKDLIITALESTAPGTWTKSIRDVCRLPHKLELLPKVTLAELQASGLFHAIKKMDDLHSELLLTPNLTPLQEAMAATFQSFHISTRLICVLDIWRKKWSNDTEAAPMFSRCRTGRPTAATMDDAAELLRLFQEESHPVALYRQLMHLEEPTSPDLLVEIWVRSRDIRSSIAKSKNNCKCSGHKGRKVTHTCRRDLEVARPLEMPQMGVALSEGWVRKHKWIIIQPDPTQGDYKHVVKMKYKNELVGLVVFNPYTEEALKKLSLNFELITDKATPVGRSATKFPYALRSGMALLLDSPVIGQGRHASDDPDSVEATNVKPESIKPENSLLYASGRRFPTGGAPGDTYAKYAWMSGDTREDRERIFAHVHDVTCAVDMISPRDNGTRAAARKVKVHDQEYETGSGFGRYDLAAFYAHNDSTAQHTDRDAAWSIATCYTKTANPGLGGSFGWSQWGVVVNARSNTAWLFDSKEQHGKVHPDCVRRDGKEEPGWAKGYSDKGMVTVLRDKDYTWAKKMHSHQHSMPTFWSSFQ